jgi:hypothetical protein
MIEIAEKICLKLGLESSKVLKRPIRGLLGYTLLDLVTALISTSSLEDAATLLGYTANPLKQSIRQVLHSHFDSRNTEFSAGCIAGRQHWRTTLLSVIDKKYCSGCRQIKLISEFHSNTANLSGLSSTCRGCKTADAKLHKLYILERTPSWSDLEAIRKIYSECPKGYEVDHVLPLRGSYVSGLHVPSNLQYLLASENRSKGNR